MDLVGDPKAWAAAFEPALDRLAEKIADRLNASIQDAVKQIVSAAETTPGKVVDALSGVSVSLAARSTLSKANALPGGLAVGLKQTGAPAAGIPGTRVASTFSKM